MRRRCTGAWWLSAVMAAAACSGPAPSSFPRAGVIEGFYGPPWSHHDRLDILAFMGRVGLDTYVYAPKLDPYHRARWRQPYPAPELARMRELVDTATAYGVTVWYAVSPGLSMTYSDTADYRALLAKIDQVTGVGVRGIGLLVDDVPTTLAHEADRQRYPTLADAHADLTNRLHADLTDRDLELLVTPTTYTGAWGDTAYVSALGSAVGSGVPIVWTGPDVASPSITADDAVAWSRRLRRPPLLWDNYPVNDFARWRLFLGPLRGRDPGLARATAGLLANPMNEAHASMIALATVAAYVRDPEHYDPDRAWADALDTLYGPDAAAVRTIAETYRGAGWESHPFEALYLLRDTIAVAPIETRLDALDSVLAILGDRAADRPALQSLLREVQPVVDRTRRRLAALPTQEGYHRRGPALVFDADRDRYDVGAAPRTVVVDGDLGEWTAPPVPLDGERASEVRLAADSSRLYVGVEVHGPRRRPRPSPRIGDGDHVALIVDHQPGDAIGPNDLVVLVPAPSDSTSTPVAVGMAWHGFMAKWLQDNRNLTVNEFLLSTFRQAPTTAWAPTRIEAVARVTSTGYAVEIAVPHGDRAHLRVSLTTMRTHPSRRVDALATRVYPANPATFATLVLPIW